MEGDTQLKVEIDGMKSGLKKVERDRDWSRQVVCASCIGDFLFLDMILFEQKPEGSEQVTDLCSNKTGVVEQMKPGEKLETIKYESLGPW